jgi:hypothetical protein
MHFAGRKHLAKEQMIQQFLRLTKKAKIISSSVEHCNDISLSQKKTNESSSSKNCMILANFALHELFPTISCQKPPSKQKGFESAIELVQTFVNSLGASLQGAWRPSDDEREALNSAVEVFNTRAPELQRPPHITCWFGEYGCVLLATEQRVGRVQLNIVCLDEWAFQVHSGLERKIQTSHASPVAVVIINVGEIDKAKYNEFCVLVQQLLAKSEQCHEDKRSAGYNEQGNQKTPALVQAILEDAMNKLLQNTTLTAPPGGFTDVGLHTGGRPRNTCWPLVRAVMQVRLEAAQHHSLFRFAMLQMRLGWLEHFVASISARTTEGITLNPPSPR